MTLAALGWNDHFAAAFAPHAAAGRQPARVTLELKGAVEVTGEDTARLGECTGRFAHDARSPADFPAVGDWVAITLQPGDDTRAAIHAVLPRRTKFSRQAAGEVAVEQVVAANLDTVFIVTALDGNFNLRRVERYLAAAWASGARPVVLLNKADLGDDTGPRAALAAIAPDLPVFAVSAQTRRGLKALTPYLTPGTTIAFLGSSGVGKSTLINRLVGEALLPTGAVRDVDGKGRHTTTQRELVVAPGGFVVLDTPGMRELQPWQAGGALDAAFGDVAAVAARCRFRDCTHTVEPGCAVRAALAAGELDSARWQSFDRLRRTTAHDASRGNRRAEQERKARTKRLTRGLQERLHQKYGEE